MFDIVSQHPFALYFGVCIVLFAFGLVFMWKDMDSDGIGPLILLTILWPIMIFGVLGEIAENGDKSTIGVFIANVLAIFLVSITIYAYHELTLSPEDELAREKALLAEEKRELEEEHAQALVEAQERIKEAEKRRAQEIKEARIQVEITKVQAERAKLRDQAIPKEIADQIAQVNKRLEQLDSQRGSNELAQANAELARLRAEGVDYSKLSQPKMSSASPSKPQEPGAPVDDQRRLVLSGLWLGACFFLQRVFEKLFKDKGYALLTVCAAGFLLAFFTANYFLLGGSVTGGLMGAAGDRT